MVNWPSNDPPEFLALDQRSGEWRNRRLGMPTASQFHRIEQLKKSGDWAEKTYLYLYELLGERRLRRALHRDVSRYSIVQYGIVNEKTAVEAFVIAKGFQLSNGGFFTRGRMGCSPDRLIGEDELLEVKCPTEPTQIRYLLEGLEEDHKPQIQGQLMITGRRKAHFWSWRDDMPSYYQEIERDEPYIKELGSMLEKFCDRLDKDELRLQQVWPVEESDDAQIMGGLG